MPINASGVSVYSVSVEEHGMVQYDDIDCDDVVLNRCFLVYCK